MYEVTLRSAPASRTGELAAWKKAAVGIVALSAAWNMVQTARIERLERDLAETAVQLELAEQARDAALERLEELSRQAERDQQARSAQTIAYEAPEVYTYIGECVITSYCPCERCCGRWADGLTATGIPAEPGIVAVDPDVIPLGATVVINGQRYLAADTGVTGNAVDICAASHEEAVEFGVQNAEVRVMTPLGRSENGRGS